MFSLREAAGERGDAPAIVTAAGSFTFGALWQRVRPIALALRDRCAAAAGAADPRRGVAVVAVLRLETLLAIYALVEIGVPIVLLHPRLTASERQALVELSGAQLVLDESWTPETPDTPETPETAARDAGLLPLEASDEDPLAILFTSGSSGSPKGVVLSRRAFHASAAASAANLGWRAEDRWLLCMPLAHVGGLSIVLRCLAARVPVVVSPWTGSLPELLHDVDALGVTLLSFVPTMLARILDELPDYRFPAAVRAVLLGGDATSPALLAAAAARGVHVLTTYGMTETCSQIATMTPGDDPSVANDGGVGRPLRGTDVRIADGQIEVRSETLFTKYLATDAAATASRWTGDGWFATGDLGRIDEAGRLHVTGRSSNLIITGGENVDPREVEAVLERCPGVRAACVFPIPDARWGQTVAAALVLVEGAELASVEASAVALLAAHKRPRRYAVCEALVLNATGKLDRRATAALMLAMVQAEVQV